MRADDGKGGMLNFCRIDGVLLLLFGKCRGWMELLKVAGSDGSGTPGNEIMHLLWNYLLQLYGLQLHACYPGQHKSIAI